jgi:hypothetical protein
MTPEIDALIMVGLSFSVCMFTIIGGAIICWLLAYRT